MTKKIEKYSCYVITFFQFITFTLLLKSLIVKFKRFPLSSTFFLEDACTYVWNGEILAKSPHLLCQPLLPIQIILPISKKKKKKKGLVAAGALSSLRNSFTKPILQYMYCCNTTIDVHNKLGIHLDTFFWWN